VISPYFGLSKDNWKLKTRELIENHPLKLDEIKEIVLKSWGILWNSRIGSEEQSISLKGIDLPSTVVGYFLEKLITKELRARYPDKWRGNISKEEKDFVYFQNSRYSIELKTSGQIGTKVFGNRSYGKENEYENAKGKSGYYITVNFNNENIFLIRFGWIDHSDWISQSAETGQAATLKQEVYDYKLITIPGDYLLDAPVQILYGIGAVTSEKLSSFGVERIKHIIDYDGENQMVLKYKELSLKYLKCED